MEETEIEREFQKFAKARPNLGKLTCESIIAKEAFREGFIAGREAFLEEPQDYVVPKVYFDETVAQNLALKRELDKLRGI